MLHIIRTKQRYTCFKLWTEMAQIKQKYKNWWFFTTGYKCVQTKWLSNLCVSLSDWPGHLLWQSSLCSHFEIRTAIWLDIWFSSRGAELLFYKRWLHDWAKQSSTEAARVQTRLWYRRVDTLAWGYTLTIKQGQTSPTTGPLLIELSWGISWPLIMLITGMVIKHVIINTQNYIIVNFTKTV